MASQNNQFGISCGRMFGGGWVYGGNDAGRFGLFCQSALEFLLQSGSSPVSISLIENFQVQNQ